MPQLKDCFRKGESVDFEITDSRQGPLIVESERSLHLLVVQAKGLGTALDYFGLNARSTSGFITMRDAMSAAGWLA